MAELSQKELNLLAYTLLGEAAGEGREGMEAVMWTIRNRAESGRYSDNPAAVATQKNSKGVYQYSTWNTKGDGGNAPKKRFSTSSPEFKEALAVAQRVMAGEVKDPTGGATHFYAEGSAKPYWFEAEGPAGEIKIGNHRFAARNTGDTAAAAAERLATGSKLAPRPQSPVLPERRPDTPASGGDSGLTTRSVQSVEINPSTGMPYPRLTPQPSRGSSSDREAIRLSEMRTQARNSNDRVGAAARVSTVNAASSEKTSRNRDLVGEAARTSTVNVASSTKTARAAQPVQPVKPAVVAQNKTIEQIGREADNARMSGYRAIQEAGPSSKGAPARPVAPAPKKSGVVKTAGTTLSDGTRLQPAGEVQLPRDVRPQVKTTVTTFIKPAVDPRRLPVGTAGMKLDPSITARPSSQQNIALQRNEQAYLRKSAGKKAITIKPEDPTLEQVVAVRDIRKGAKGVGRPIVRSPIVLANGAIAAQPQLGSVAAQIAQVSRIGSIGQGGAYTTNQYQQDRFQTLPGQLMPAATNTDNWTGPSSSNDNNSKNDWHWW